MTTNRFILIAEILLVFLLMAWGWGFASWERFMAQPARSGLIAALLVGSGALLWWKLELLPMRRGLFAAGFQAVELTMLISLSAGLIWFLPHADRFNRLTFQDVAWVRLLGLALCCAGMIIRVAAIRELGRQFSAFTTLQPDHQLIQTGLYRWIRHPLYLSLLLAAPGFALVFRSFLVWPILALSLGFIVTRIREEERLLATHFGDEYVAYRNRTGTLIPGLL